VGDAPVEDGIGEFEFETASGSDAAFRGQRAAHHQVAGAEAALRILFRKDFEEVRRGQHSRDGAMLVAHAAARDRGMGGEFEAVPVRGDIIEAPEAGCDGFVAKLLGERDADGFSFAIGVVGAGTDPQVAMLTRKSSTSPLDALPIASMRSAAVRRLAATR